MVSRIEHADNPYERAARALFVSGMKTHVSWEIGGHCSMPKGAPRPKLTTRNTSDLGVDA